MKNFDRWIYNYFKNFETDSNAVMLHDQFGVTIVTAAPMLSKACYEASTRVLAGRAYPV